MEVDIRNKGSVAFTFRGRFVVEFVVSVSVQASRELPKLHDVLREGARLV